MLQACPQAPVQPANRECQVTLHIFVHRNSEQGLSFITTVIKTHQASTECLLTPPRKQSASSSGGFTSKKGSRREWAAPHLFLVVGRVLCRPIPEDHVHTMQW